MEEIKAFDWFRMWVSHDTPLGYFGEIAFRTIVLFLFLLVMLKFLSKRGAKQLSIFEMAIVIALGSAAGDPMFQSKTPLLHGMLAILLVVLMYRSITYLIFKSTALEALLEGRPLCVLKEGQIDYAEYKKSRLSTDDFFAELREKSVDHLGQLRLVYLETSGEVSVYFQEDKDVRPGLPIYPELINAPLQTITEAGLFACVECGHVEDLQPAGRHKCPKCNDHYWLPTRSNRRVS